MIRLKKRISWILAVCLLLSLTACGEQAEETVASFEVSQSGLEESELITITNEEETLNDHETSQEHILIAYFSWADNTAVEVDGNNSDVDAVTSASVVAPGNTARLAQWIQEYVGGDLFPIVVTEPYPDDYDECLDRAADEKAENARPELTNYLDNIDDYDIIFLGFPNWWYTAPMAIFSFIEEYDLSDKTIVPFCTHGTGGLASCIRDITTALPDSAEVLEPLGVYREDIEQAQSEVNEWLLNLGFQEKEELTAEMEDGERKVKMTIDGQEIFITLYDTTAANALYDMLPLDLSFEDYNGVEKISYLSQTLPTTGEPDGYDPDIGDLCLYAPWENLSVFYQDFRYSDGLILLGHIDSGMDLISAHDGEFSTTLEMVD